MAGTTDKNRKVDAASSKKRDVDALLDHLIGITGRVSRGHYEKPEKIFEMTRKGTYPERIVELAESFGLLIVKVEGREYKLELIIDKLKKANRELTASKRKIERFNSTLEQKVLDKTKEIREKNQELTKILKQLKKENLERKRAEQELRKFTAALEKKTEELNEALEREKELGELKSRFVSMVSHEFRTPLTSILASSDLLKRYSLKMTEDQKMDRLNKIQAEVKLMNTLMDEVLLIGRAEAGKLGFNPVPIDLEDFCKEIIEEIGITEEAEHPILLSFAGESKKAKMDEKLLRQIISNLLSNAVKYSSGGSKVQFEVSCGRREAVFRVTDRGIGIPPQDQKRLFEPFHRANNVGTVSGTGLGLTILKRAVDLHGGTIHVDSREGKGTTFEVRIKTGG